MKNRILLVLALTAVSASLLGCQSEESATQKIVQNKPEQQSKVDSVKISKIKGDTTIAFRDTQFFESMLINAKKEEGIVNVTNPEYKLELVYVDSSKQLFYLWVGEKGETSTLMKTDDTHTIYTVSEELTDELIELMK